MTKRYKKGGLILNYLRVYKEIIDSALHRKKYTGIYYEAHHIIPKCLGGCNSTENLVNLTAREHFIVHWILTKIYPNSRKIICAFNAFAWRINGNSTCKKDFSSKKYEYAKSKLAKYLTSNKDWADECRERAKNTIWINNKLQNKHVKYYLVEEYINNGWKLGRTKHKRRPPSEEVRKKMSIGRTGIYHTQETKDKIKRTLNSDPRLWVNDNFIEKMIHSSEKRNYINNGWFLGRINGKRFRNNKYKEN